MGFILFLVFGFILLGITSFGVVRLESKSVLLSNVKKIIFWFVISPFWIIYALIAVSGFINATDMIDEKFFDKKTAYFIYCSDYKYNIYSCPDDKKFHTMKIDFKVSFDKQIVVEDAGATYKHTKCSVFDANNWSCESGEKTLYVQDGVYSESIQNNFYPTIEKDGKPSALPVNMTVDKSEYFFREFINFFSSF